jgi:hypothetical protein
MAFNVAMRQIRFHKHLLDIEQTFIKVVIAITLHE